MNTQLRQRAAQIVDVVADRLADAPRVAEIAGAPHNVITTIDGTVPLWSPLNLSDGYPGVALLFAELAAHDPARRRSTHDHLVAGLAASPSPPPAELYSGAGALTYAAQAAARIHGGYATLLAMMDRNIAEEATAQAEASRARIDAGEPIGHWASYDLICGTGGLGCYLLARHELADDGMVTDALTTVLSLFTSVALADDVTLNGVKVPAWWVRHDQLYNETDSGGHLDLGMAHGMSGVLALLALAWRAGVRVDRQDEAISRIVAKLNEFRLTDAAGPYWPTALMAVDIVRPSTERPRERDVWCRGSAGLARALHLAGAAFGNADWQADARDTLLAALGTADPGRVNSMTLCHGWSGLLQITWRMAMDTGDPSYRDACDALASTIIDGFDEKEPFGFAYIHPRTKRKHDRPGFLEGAAGIALALHAYAGGEPPVTNWDAVLLLN
ncbi:lanthionine synthetase C family protein [Actinoallomurus bryophytorum]|uniref:Lanthionine synthetase-like protein n=1 Tax=Actinoallomurus bryophytorum TaxID=1490222 RepID=A0A543CUF1_9ACTN|nr:lanthionine synthetase C family protein [Actinoallomurus bryophytorum]TQM00745.1 lanthionine synthetase-like protein [Actinoallomurus bryophytorum]